MIRQGIIGIAALLFVGCTSEMDRKLEGKWQLKQTEKGGVVTPVDTVYYNFQNTLFMYQIANSPSGINGVSYGYKTEIGENELKLELESRDFLPYTDWGTDTCRIFSVEYPSRSRLILKADETTYEFKKF